MIANGEILSEKICNGNLLGGKIAHYRRLVQASLNLLKGIHDEAVEWLKAKPIPPKSLRLLKKVTGERQREIARLMIDAHNYFAGYAEGLVLGTHKEFLVAADPPKKKKGMTAESIAKMEQEMEPLQSGMKAIPENSKENMFTWQTAHTYNKALLKNTRVAKYLKAKHAEISTEFQNMAAAEAVCAAKVPSNPLFLYLDFSNAFAQRL